MVEFGKKLKKLRQQEGLTQQQLADLLGLSKSVISYYELHERCPSPEILIRLSAIFHVSTDYLLGIERKEIIDLSDLNEEDIITVKRLVSSLRTHLHGTSIARPKSK